jgi:hypothetical protein
MALKQRVPGIAIAAVAAVITWLFAWTVLRHTRPMGLPLDDSYIYLTYAKMAGRGAPFTYYPGGGYSAGSTSVLWPLLLAPFWTLGARGHALVWVSFLLCAALYAATAIGCYQIARRISNSPIVAAVAAMMTFAIAPYAWCALSGMEVAFASALLVATILLLLDQPRTGRPPWKLILCLAATSLSRPELTMIAGGVVALAALQRLRQRDLRAALWWCVPLVMPLAWVTANRVLAGHWFPNTGVVKSHFYLPGFTWGYWLSAVGTQTGNMVRGLFWSSDSPLIVPKLFALAWVIGGVRTIRWAIRNGTPLAGVLIVATPLVLIEAVICTSAGRWDFQNYRYVAPAFPLFAITAAMAFVRPRIRLFEAFVRSRGRVWAALSLACGVAYFALGVPRLRFDMQLFAQGASDTNTQVVALGHAIHDAHPGARVMFHDAGAISYYGDGPVYDMLGLVTNFQADVANNGGGSRFEFLESLPPERRPDLFAYYPPWMGTNEFYGAVLQQTPLRSPFIEQSKRLAGGQDMQLIAASWDHVGTAERPFHPQPGWTLVDRIDVADLASERAHAWHGKLGTRALGDPTAKWSFVERETRSTGLVIDGGRTIREGGETFRIGGDASKPTHLIMRTGGQAQMQFGNGAITKAETLEVFADGQSAAIAHATLPVPDGSFRELQLELPAGTPRDLRVEVSGGWYRVFHWFVLQPL